MSFGAMCKEEIKEYTEMNKKKTAKDWSQNFIKFQNIT